MAKHKCTPDWEEIILKPEPQAKQAQVVAKNSQELQATQQPKPQETKPQTRPKKAKRQYYH